jgi:nitroimidazol reductase NimA-like FMN-containing flavoprotein (pyridoxamine 5'-phosphate oxidase superfamily)
VLGDAESVDGEPITVLSEDESWNRLASVPLGRLVASVGGQPEIFPVNFVVQSRTVLFRTSEGTKLFAAVASNRVAFEADDYNVAEGWSVIVKGRAQVLHTSSEIEKAERAQLKPWIPTLKLHYVRVIPYEITGRHFRFGPEPDRHSTFA